MNYQNDFKHSASAQSTCSLIFAHYKLGVTKFLSLLALLICVFYKIRHLNNAEPRPLGKSISFLFFFFCIQSPLPQIALKMSFSWRGKCMRIPLTLSFFMGVVYFLNEDVCVCVCVCTSLGPQVEPWFLCFRPRSCFSGREWRQLCLQLKSWHTFTRIYYSYHSVSGRDLRPPVYLTNSPFCELSVHSKLCSH